MASKTKDNIMTDTDRGKGSAASGSNTGSADILPDKPGNNIPENSPSRPEGRGGCNIVSLIALTHSRMIRPFERSFANKYTGLQIIILCMLLENGPCSITDIASQLCLSKQQIAKLIAKLNLRGCVRRFHPSEDHRVVLVDLTEETADMMRRQHEEFYGRIAERIEEDGEDGDLKRFNDAVSEMTRVLLTLPRHRRSSAETEPQ